MSFFSTVSFRRPGAGRGPRFQSSSSAFILTPRKARGRSFDLAQDRSQQGFTLIELLVVIAIIAILSIVIVLTLNPAEMLRQSRDATRLSDLDTLTHAMSLYQTDKATQGGMLSLGIASTVYVSLPDMTLSGNQTSTCISLGLPVLPAGYLYQCTSPQSYRDTDGTGWLPVSLTSLTTGSPLGSLPVDPQNQSSTNLFYTYQTNGTQYELTSLFESAKYKAQYAGNPLIPGYPEVNAKGSSLTLSPLWNPQGLVGYWPLDEGTGSSTIDASGNGNAGTWQGNASGTNGTYYTAGSKIGPYAGYFNGVNNSITLPTFSINSVSIAGWISPGVLSGYYNSFVILSDLSTANVIGIRIDNTTPISVDFLVNASSTSVIGKNASLKLISGYNFIATVLDTSANTYAIYINGQLSNNGTFIGSLFTSYNRNCMGCTNGAVANNYAPFNGIDDVRIYNRALSAAEIQALYNAEK